MRRRKFLWLAAVCVAFLYCGGAATEPAESFALSARSRAADGSTSEQNLRWEPSESAIVVCDMWDRHWCDSATMRVGEMAPRMNDVLAAARELGVRVVHAPSSVVGYYEATPFRQRILAAPTVEPPVPINPWCNLEPDKEIKLPIDDSDGGCDDESPVESYTAWSKQHAAIKMMGEDVVSDDGREVFNYFRQQGVRNVAVMGVHANMCVLGRSFAIRQLTKLGFNVVLVRDLTDAMYDPRDAPFVSHASGTELVVEHIERYWCPSILGQDLTRLVAEGS